MPAQWMHLRLSPALNRLAGTKQRVSVADSAEGFLGCAAVLVAARLAGADCQWYRGATEGVTVGSHAPNCAQDSNLPGAVGGNTTCALRSWIGGSPG